PEQCAVVLGDDDLCVVVREPLEPGDDVARSGRVALVGEQRRDRLGVAGARMTELDRGLVGHTRMVPGPSTTRRCGPVNGSRPTRRSGPNGRVVRGGADAPRTVTGPRAPGSRSAAAYQATSGPSSQRASAAAMRPSVAGSTTARATAPGGGNPGKRSE